MAIDEKNSDENGADAAVKPPSGGTKKIILIVAASVALVGASVGSTLLLTSLLGKGEEIQKVSKKKTKAARNNNAEEADANDEEAEEADVNDETEKGKGGEEDDEDDSINTDGTPQSPIYLDFDQPFIVNFIDEGQLRYLQITVSVMTMDPKMVDELKRHTPLIRNNLVMQFSGQTRDGIISREGKEKIRREAEAEVQRIMKERIGKPAIKSLYFTSFVMQ